MADYEFLRTVRDGGVAHIELHRPDSLNAWTPRFGRELLDALREAGADPSARAILITGAGRVFSVGGDVKSLQKYRPEEAQEGKSLSSGLGDIYNQVILAVREAPKPVVAAIHGAAAGLGASLALSCDLVVAAESAYLLLAFVHIGVMPDAGVMRFLAERVGISRATELAMLGERLPAAKALEWGLVYRVVPDDTLPEEGMALAQRLANGPTLALANIKKTLTETVQADLSDHLVVEAARQEEHATSFDFKEGRRAFVEKRKPEFQGR